MSRPGATDSDLSGQPFVTMGGGALPLPLPMPTQPATLTATRVATKAMSTFFIGVPLSSRHAMHTSCLAAPLVARCRRCVHCLRDRGALWKGTVSLGTQLGAPGKFVLVPLPLKSSIRSRNSRRSAGLRLPPTAFRPLTPAWPASLFVGAAIAAPMLAPAKPVSRRNHPINPKFFCLLGEILAQLLGRQLVHFVLDGFQSPDVGALGSQRRAVHRGAADDFCFCVFRCQLTISISGLLAWAHSVLYPGRIRCCIKTFFEVCANQPGGIRWASRSGHRHLMPQRTIG